MKGTMTLVEKLKLRISDALTSLLVDIDVTPQVSVSADLQFGDYQSNISMMLAKRLKKNPREFAQQLIDVMQVDDLATVELAGPGFINFRITPEAWNAQITALFSDKRLGVPELKKKKTIVVDFSSPNVAKPMHVGHIRSTIIGDSLAKVARFLGHNVITDNHIGDWGTQFGMVIYGWKKDLNADALTSDPLTELLRIYRSVTAACKEDEAIKDACRTELVKLQQGDAENTEIWTKVVEVSKTGLNKIYDQLDVTFDHWYGESFYNDHLKDTVQGLVDAGMAKESDGAICVFSNNELSKKQDPFIKNEDGEWKDHPMIIRKRDGGYNYATSDLATIDFRVKEWDVDEVLYVVDARQAEHFKQLFNVAERQGVKTKLEHVSFGTINGKDGKPLKTRAGDLPELQDILNDAIAAAREVLEEKSSHLPEEEKLTLADSIGISSVKFTELSHHRTSDYIFDLDKMVSLTGDTAPYLQYSYVRVRSIFRKLEAPVDLSKVDFVVTDAGEINLSRMLCRFGEVLPTVLDGYKPNNLSSYLIELARAFHSFFESCPVLQSDCNTKETRLYLCDLTGRVLKQGLDLLGISTPERM